MNANDIRFNQVAQILEEEAALTMETEWMAQQRREREEERKRDELQRLVTEKLAAARRALEAARQRQVEEATRKARIIAIARANIKAKAPCTICYNPVNGQLAVTKCCGHVFCGKCIDEWIQIKLSCPMCRTTNFSMWTKERSNPN